MTKKYKQKDSIHKIAYNMLPTNEKIKTKKEII